ncbi:MAG: peroxiredoxin [bacterium]|nr:peroxiredoxin [bacterium]
MEPTTLARVGAPAPDFKAEGYAPDGSFKTYSLAENKGKWVVLFFYPADFTFICPTEITEFSTHNADFAALNAVVFGASTDSVHSHKAWGEGKLGKLNYPLLADSNHSLSTKYGVLIPDQGQALRGTFVIDPEGFLRYALYHDLGVGRSVKECLRVVAALQTGELCPASWEPGKPTLGKA